MAAKFGKNQKVADTLDTYLQQDKPRFAVLLQGKWGSGKTWFIRNYIDKTKDKNHDFCYVSLFDIEQLKEIDNQIIAHCNPILSKAEGVGRFAGGFIERCIPLIKYDDVKDLGNLLKKLCKISKNLVLVLDDLERSRISMDLVLGYVSNMLDQVGIKVILLCDQDQFEDKTKEKFLRFKEKVVGSSITIIPDIETVFDFQVKSIDNQEIKKVIQNNKTSLLKDFNSSKTDNLRNIKRIIYEFSMCYEQMTTEMQKNEPYLAEFLHTLFIFSIQIHKGLPREKYNIDKISICNYYKFPEYYISRGTVYSQGNWSAPIASEFIEKFFYNGIIDEILLYDSYIKSEYAKDPEIPLILYYKFSKLDDCEVDNLYKQMKEEINKFKYTSFNVILHAFDVMLKFSQIGLETISENEIVYSAHDYLSKVKFSDVLLDIDNLKRESSFLTINSPEFSEIYKSIYKYIDEFRKKEIDEVVQKITYLLPNAPDQFIENFPYNYTDTVKITFFNAKELARRISQVPNSKLRYVLERIYYNIRSIPSESSEGFAWVKEFHSSLKENLKSMPPIAKNTVENLIEQFKISIPNK